MNTNTVVGQDKLAGFGLVARDNDGEILAAASLFPTVAMSPTIVEALVSSGPWSYLLSWGLGEFSWKHIVYNCTKLVYLFSIVHDCFKFSDLFDHVDLFFVRRGGNSCADFMARNTSSLSNVFGWRKAPKAVS